VYQRVRSQLHRLEKPEEESGRVSGLNVTANVSILHWATLPQPSSKSSGERSRNWPRIELRIAEQVSNSRGQFKEYHNDQILGNPSW
jgi:hypothetical protein